MEFSPLCRRGGVNRDLLDRVSLLESELAELKQKKASETEYGLGKISASASVTEDDGLLLSAKEKNDAISGSLANRIGKVEENLGKIAFGSIVVNPNGSVVEIQAPEAIHGAIIACNGEPGVMGEAIIGVSVYDGKIRFHLAREVKHNIRINYIYQKKGNEEI